MKKSNQIISASFVAVLGIILMSVNGFSASADSLNTYSSKISTVVIVGLVLMAIAALWFFLLSRKDKI